MDSLTFRRVIGGIALVGAWAGCAANSPNGGQMGGSFGGTGGTGAGAGTAAGQPAGTNGAPVGGGANGTGVNSAGTGGSSAVLGGTGGTGAMPAGGGQGGAPMAATGTGGMSGGGGAAGMNGAAGSGMDPMLSGAKMPCMTKGSDLLMIGDSYIDAPVNLAPPLESDATKAMQLASGDHYIMKAVAGTVISQIQGQWMANKSPVPKFVVMDGGGNDVLLGAPQCLLAQAGDATCMGIVDMANVTGKAIMDDMKASGVKGMVYFFYPHIPLGGAAMLDYSLPIAQKNCESMNDANFTCVFVNSQPALDNHMEYYLDGIHPSAAGGPQALADIVWKGMQAGCIGQESGCCTP